MWAAQDTSCEAAQWAVVTRGSCFGAGEIGDGLVRCWSSDTSGSAINIRCLVLVTGDLAYRNATSSGRVQALKCTCCRACGASLRVAGTRATTAVKTLDDTEVLAHAETASYIKAEFGPGSRGSYGKLVNNVHKDAAGTPVTTNWVQQKEESLS